jgi:hypothetical protein
MATAEPDLIRREIAEAEKELVHSPRSHKDLIEQFKAVAFLSVVEEAKEARSVEELREWTEASSSLLRLMRHSSRDLLRELLEVFEQLIVKQQGLTDEALEEWGRLQAIDSYGRVRDDCYTIRWLEEHGRSRQQVGNWKRRGALFAIEGLPGVKGHAYPRWQFDPRLRPKKWVAPLVEAANEAQFDPVALHLFMTNPDAGPSWVAGEATPVEVADAGGVDEVVQLVRAGNAHSG